MWDGSYSVVEKKKTTTKDGRYQWKIQRSELKAVTCNPQDRNSLTEMETESLFCTLCFHTCASLVIHLQIDSDRARLTSEFFKNRLSEKKYNLLV